MWHLRDKNVRIIKRANACGDVNGHIAGVEVKKRKKQGAVGGRPPSTTGFDVGSKQHTQSKCVACSKTVYPMEYVGVGLSFACIVCLFVNFLQLFHILRSFRR
jgi:hypothetical protein